MNAFKMNILYNKTECINYLLKPFVRVCTVRTISSDRLYTENYLLRPLVTTISSPSPSPSPSPSLSLTLSLPLSLSPSPSLSGLEC